LAGVPTCPIDVLPVQSAGDRDLFVHLPARIYASDPAWVSPLLFERKLFIRHDKHPFYKHGAAAQFLAVREGQVVGRIQASDDPNYNAQHGTDVGCFGLFECVDDPAVAKALLDRAAEWLGKRGRTRIMGPIDYSTNYACGLLVDGFDTPPRVMMNHNPSYYARLLEGWGLAKIKDLYCWWFDDPHDMLTKWRRRAARFAERSSVEIRSLDARRFDREINTFKAIYNDAWHKNWGFVRMTDDELRYFGKLLMEVGLPEMLLVAEVDGQPAGVSLAVPDINEAMKPLDGRLTTWGLPIGLWKLKRAMRRIKTCRLFTLGIVEKYRRRGVAELLILRTLDFGKNQRHYSGAELSWTLEDNDLINRTIEAVGGRRYKTYRIFDKPLG
jgi:GNAT superfamily N-acetyltransferase